MPWVAKSVFGPVPARPSGPPSVTFTVPSCQFDLLSSTTAPGISALNVVDSEQAAPICALVVAVQGTVAGKSTSWVVAGSA